MIWSYLMLPLLLCSGSADKLKFYQPENTHFVDVGKEAVISCYSNLFLDAGKTITWYHRNANKTEPPKKVAYCFSVANAVKYACDTKEHITRLIIRNVQSNDSGVYYCTLLYRSELTFGNGTSLIVKDNFMSGVLVRLLKPPQTHLANTTVQLACLVQKATDMINIRWNISGTYHMGRMNTAKKADGTWDFLNYISLTENTWDPDDVTCEVWFETFLLIRTRESQENVSAVYQCLQRCSFYLRFVLGICFLLILFISIHLSSTYK